MLVVVAEETQALVLKHDPRAEHNPVPLGQLVDLPGAQHEMGEFGRADRICRRGKPADRDNIVHLVSPFALLMDPSLHKRRGYREMPSYPAPANSSRSKPLPNGSAIFAMRP